MRDGVKGRALRPTSLIHPAGGVPGAPAPPPAAPPERAARPLSFGARRCAHFYPRGRGGPGAEARLSQSSGTEQHSLNLRLS